MILQKPDTAWKSSVFGVILVCIFPHSDLIRIQSECGKMWTRITPNTDSFYAMRLLSIENVILFRQSIVCSCITFSTILETVGRSEIGLKFSGSFLVPFLYRGLSFANLKSIVKWDIFTDNLQICVMGWLKHRHHVSII